MSSPGAKGPCPGAIVAARQLAGRVRDILEHITAEQRSVFLLRAEDCTETEIAARLGISVANVKIRAYRARQRLRHALRPLQA